ncbi:U3 small nucleolar RNA-associated protein 6-domain-containing protein [Collybia nuda]|uniref:U3 small nucleolar RNA-associated protein 6-domain-containing protein n=1 Tax=Collybia nuda TaxID=64659 RepID=A0A9P5YEN7_9AGAR|nr:U3 small nucleolar RNA-associated protein 6-domain-containing protein [Collybia nuda]
MERVQFQQEQMLDELKDLVEKNLFTQKETKQIMKKRTAFETALVRRVAKKADFLRYASYEMGLEQLRRKRIERTKSGPSPPTVSDYAFVRRQFHVFERALKKFKSDVGLWIQYIQVAKREGARALVGRITARALQLHPNQPALYVLAASHELDHLSPSAARTLLQRGIRLNADSVDMWREYVRMELGFVESLRRRWDVLGINAQLSDKGKGKADDLDDPSYRIMGGRHETEPIQDSDMDEEVEGAQARREIMQGAIVKSVITSAVKALPKIELFEALNTLLLEYPTQPSVRAVVMDHLYELLRCTLPDNAGAIKLLANRFLVPELKGEAFVDGLRSANEEMMQSVGEGRREPALQAYAAFIEEWCGAAIDVNLKQYLILSLGSLIARSEHANASPSLLAVHLRLLITLAEAGLVDPAKVVRTGRKYTTKAPKSAYVWLARLGAEKRFAATDKGRDVVDTIWGEARRSVLVEESSEEELEKLWTWGLFPEGSVTERLKIHEGLLKESMRDGRLRGLHETLLISFVRTAHEGRGKPDSGLTSDQAEYSARWLHSVRHMARVYLTTGRVWQQVFSTIEEEDWGSESREKRQVLGEVFEKWRQKDELEATLEWARWLLSSGKGKEATEAVVVGCRSIGEEGRVELERRWMGIVGRS